MIVDEDKGLVAMITEVNLAPSAKKIEWLLDSSAIIYVWNNKDMFNIYVQEQSGIFMGNYASIQLMGK